MNGCKDSWQQQGDTREPFLTAGQKMEKLNMEENRPKVLNKSTHGVPAGSVYIGRPSKWGNPFWIGRDGDRAEVIAKFEQYILTTPQLLSAVGELHGRDLVCWCAPESCHGDVLLRLAALALIPDGGKTP